MLTVASLFSGGKLFEVGAIAAGLRPLWGVEIDDAIADVAERNIPAPTIRRPVQDVDYTALERPYWLHMSPPCVNASQAKARAVETALDIEMADGCVRAISALNPPIVSLENVWGYRHFESFRRIVAALRACGYAFDYWHLNAADYGVPQTRKRLILLASREFVPRCPEATHYDARDGQCSLLLRPWIGWYEAIEDMVPALPESQLAPWQLERLSACSLIGGGVAGCRSIRARSWLVGDQSASEGQGVLLREEYKPAMTIRVRAAPRAWLEQGRVVRMTPRALARFQSVPDWYVLPERDRLACTIIGNGVPCLFAQRVVEAMLRLYNKK